jgi:hypothetical protein
MESSVVKRSVLLGNPKGGKIRPDIGTELVPQFTNGQRMAVSD